MVIQHRRMEKKAKQHQEKEKTVRKSPSPLSDESLVVIDQSLMRLALKRCEDQYNKMRRNHSKLCSATGEGLKKQIEGHQHPLSSHHLLTH